MKRCLTVGLVLFLVWVPGAEARGLTMRHAQREIVRSAKSSAKWTEQPFKLGRCERRTAYTIACALYEQGIGFVGWDRGVEVTPEGTFAHTTVVVMKRRGRLTMTQWYRGQPYYF